jgi:subtilisin
LTLLLSSTVFANTLVGTSYASQAQVQSPQSTQASPTTQAPRPPTPICNPNSPPLQPGSTGAKVAELQRVLIQIGYGSLVEQADGKFGTSTQNAVKKFQQDNRLPVDGRVGRITWGTLCAIIPNSFIVQLKSDSPRPLSPGSTREIVGMLTPQLAGVGGRVVAVYDQFGMFNVVFERPQRNLEQIINSLRTHPAVQGVFRDGIIRVAQLLPQTIPTGIDRIDADLSAAISGDGVGNVDADIAILDTGVSAHGDLNIFRCVSFIGLFPSLRCTDGFPGGGHGTHVAGIAAARDNNMGTVGAAPGARIWAIKVIHDNGNGDDSDVLEGLNFVATPPNDVEVVNLSLQRLGSFFPYFIAINELVSRRDVVVVAAAGNDNIDAVYSNPGNVFSAITVSAISDSDGKCGGAGPSLQEGRTDGQVRLPQAIPNPDDFFASYSNYGPAVDLAAPGGNIYSTDSTGSYKNESGTSQAAPYVAGAAALYKSLHPTAKPIQIEKFLKDQGTRVPAGANLRVCDLADRGYFEDNYGTVKIAGIGTDAVREPLLYMGTIR